MIEESNAGALQPFVSRQRQSRRQPGNEPLLVAEQEDDIQALARATRGAADDLRPLSRPVQRCSESTG